MKYVEYLKKHDTFDKYILLLLSLGFSAEQTSELLGVTRQTVYNAKKRNAALFRRIEKEK